MTSPFHPSVRKWIIWGVFFAITVGLILPVAILAIGGTGHEHLKLALDSVKLGFVGFLVAFLGFLIPLGFSEARHKFEKSKEARIAFSRAKTGVDYLSLRLAVLPLKEASALLQELHVWKHTAELYPDEISIFLGQRKEKLTPKEWADLLYEQLHAVRDALEANADKWSRISVSKRIATLDKAQKQGIRTWELNTGKNSLELIAQPTFPADGPGPAGSASAEARR